MPPIKYIRTRDRIAKVLSLIANGESVRAACKKAGIDRSVFLNHVDGEQYARARDAQADTHFAGLVDLEAQCLDRKLDPQRFKAVLDSMKWRLARMKPQVYSEQARLALEFNEPPKLEIILPGISENEGFGRQLAIGEAKERIDDVEDKES